MDYSTDFLSYVETMLWSSTDMGTDEPCDSMDAYDLCNFAPETIELINNDIDSFWSKVSHLDLSDHDSSQVMHDFWLTRNGHGAGFWDGDYEEKLGQALTDISKEFKELTPVIGGDQKIYLEG